MEVKSMIVIVPTTFKLTQLKYNTHKENVVVNIPKETMKEKISFVKDEYNYQFGVSILVVVFGELLDDIHWGDTEGVQIRPKLIKENSKGRYYDNNGRVYLNEEENELLDKFIHVIET